MKYFIQVYKNKKYVKVSTFESCLEDRAYEYAPDAALSFCYWTTAPRGTKFRIIDNKGKIIMKCKVRNNQGYNLIKRVKK